MKTEQASTRSRPRFVSWPLRVAGIAALLWLSCLLAGKTALAQTPRSFLIPRPEFLAADQDEFVAAVGDEEPEIEAAAAPTKVRLMVDTDAGVDDAAAIAWLLSQTRYPVEIVGFAAVAGNTTVENVANNLLLLKNVTGRTDIPVVIGAAAPLSLPLSSTGKLIHGPDGLSFQGWSNPQDISGLPGYGDPDAVVDFYCDTPDKQNITILALGPLTNLARAIESCPYNTPESTGMEEYRAIVVLGGAKYGGNYTPAVEYNFGQDPQAAAALMAFVAPGPWTGPPSPLPPPKVPVSMVPLDTFSQLTIDLKDVEKLADKKSPVGQFLAPALGSYICAKSNLPGVQAWPYSECLATLPKGTKPQDVRGTVNDLVATMYALNRKLGQEESALVKVMAPVDPALRLVQGQSIIGLSFQERVTMIADDEELSFIADCAFYNPPFGGPGCLPSFEIAVDAILAREPDNVAVVTAVDSKKMVNDFLKDVTAKPRAAASVNEVLAGETAADDGTAPQLNEHLYLPLVSDE